MYNMNEDHCVFSGSAFKCQQINALLFDKSSPWDASASTLRTDSGKNSQWFKFKFGTLALGIQANVVSKHQQHVDAFVIDNERSTLSLCN